MHCCGSPKFPALERHQCEDPTLGQVTQQQILGDVDDRGIAALRRLGRRVAENVALGQPDVIRIAHVAGCRPAGSNGNRVSATENRALWRLRLPRGPNQTFGAERPPSSAGRR